MFTRCPNCDTHFEITQEYLDIAHGKVRCGRCDHVFNALDNLCENETAQTEIEAESSSTIEEKIENKSSDSPVSSKVDSQTDSESEQVSADDPSIKQIEDSFPGINIKEKMEQISASLSAATEELKNVRRNPAAVEQTSDIDNLPESNKQHNEAEQKADIEQKSETPVDDTEINDKPEPEDELDTIDEEPEVEDELDIIEEETKKEAEDDDIDLIDYDDAEEEDSHHKPTHPVIDPNTPKVNTADLDVLNSLMEAVEEDGFSDYSEKSVETEADRKLLDDFNTITDNIPDDFDSLDDELSSLDDAFAAPAKIDKYESLDDDDDFEELDDADDLLAELDQIENDFRNKEKNAAQQYTDDASSAADTRPDSSKQSSSQTSNREEEVVPSFLTQEDAPESNPSAVFGWLAATLSLLLLLTIQYLHFNSAELSQSPKMQSLVKPLCQLTGCSVPLIKTPRKIVTVSHDVRTYPAIKNSLEIQLTFKNKALYTQSYPILEITFLNPGGKVIARRKFLPAEYLTDDVNYSQGIKRNQRQDIDLKIIDPDPATLLSFQFNYL